MTIKEQHKPWQVRLQGTDEAHSAEQNGRVNVRGCFAFPSTDEEIMLPLLCWLLRTSVQKIGMLCTIEQASLRNR